MCALSLIDIVTSIKNPKKYFSDERLKQSLPEMFNGQPILSSGNYGVVFKFKYYNGHEKAIRVWTKDLQVMPNLLRHSKILAEKIKQIKKPYFVNFDFQDKGLLVSGQWTPIVVMDWCSGKDLKDTISENINNTVVLKKLSSNFFELIMSLHEQGISHGDLQHGNIIIDKNFTMKLIDYDSLFIPCEEFKNNVEEIKGLPNYQHPKRMINKYANSKVDYFSELIIYLSLCAVIENPYLWEKYNVNIRDYSLLFEQQDFYRFEQSKIYNDLMSLSDNIKKLTSILVKYLKCSDINQLNPFYYEMKDITIPTITQPEYFYCTKCGHKFYSLDDDYCTYCGKPKRNLTL